MNCFRGLLITTGISATGIVISAISKTVLSPTPFINTQVNLKEKYQKTDVDDPKIEISFGTIGGPIFIEKMEWQSNGELCESISDSRNSVFEMNRFLPKNAWNMKVPLVTIRPKDIPGDYQWGSDVKTDLRDLNLALNVKYRIAAWLPVREVDLLI